MHLIRAKRDKYSVFLSTGGLSILRRFGGAEGSVPTSTLVPFISNVACGEKEPEGFLGKAGPPNPELNSILLDLTVLILLFRVILNAIERLTLIVIQMHMIGAELLFTSAKKVSIC